MNPMYSILDCFSLMLTFRLVDDYYVEGGYFDIVDVVDVDCDGGGGGGGHHSCQ